MSEEFKKKLEAYMEGKLPPEEQEEMERELNKLEAYQSLLEEKLKDEESEESRKETKTMSHEARSREAKIIRRGKWKARMQNALTAIGILLVITIFCSGFTSLFFSLGKPSRIETYRDVVASTVAVTQPNVMLKNSGTQIQSFFTLKMEGNLQKIVGGEDAKAGDMKVFFLLGQAGYPQYNWMEERDHVFSFVYPESPSVDSFHQEWGRLEKLPEGTVAEAYLSFDDFYSTDEILQRFKDREMRPVWFAVDTGYDEEDPEFPIGFPYSPLWHYEDKKVVQHSEKKWGWFGTQVSELAVMPTVEAYGSGALRNKNFINTLKLLEKYQSITDRIIIGRPVDMQEKLQYINDKGVRIYGMVVTGPTKEILKLKEEPWVRGIHVGETDLWNWE